MSVDASSCGIGAVLLQRQLDGSVKPVSYERFAVSSHHFLDMHVELSKLSAITSQDVINHKKSIFAARHGIPNEVVLDNGLQFSSNVFHSFAGE